MIDPVKQKKQRKQTSDRRKKHRDAKVQLIQPPVETSTLTKRAVEARAKIREMVGAKPPESSVLKKPTRRRKRHPNKPQPMQ